MSNQAKQIRYLNTRTNLDKLHLVQRGEVWQYEDGQGQVRLSILIPATFATEKEAREAAARVAIKVDVNGKVVF